MDPETKTYYPEDEPAHETHNTACDSMPDSTRLRYFHGQLLGHQDLQTEQDYFREKLKLLNRCLHGYGTVCGLKVVPVLDDPECESSSDDYDPKQQTGGEHEQHGYKEPKHGYKDRPGACVEIECGLALDCEGNELMVRQPIRVDIWRHLSDAERQELMEDIRGDRKQRPRVYLSICYCVQPIDPVRPKIPDACNAVSECIYSKLRDTVKVKLSLRRPTTDHCRNNCCDKCKNKCLLLASIVFSKDKPIVVRNDIRRWITTYEPVTITGVNWVHGATNYTAAEARKILQDDGLTIQFSRPILTETVTKGVVDVLVFQGGRGQHGGIYFLDGDLSTPDNRHIVFKYSARETLQGNDRVLVIVRTDFILDECCRPVDGNHVGGRVPLLPAFIENKPAAGMPPSQQSCVSPPRRYGAWTSGDGSGGSTFESWFFIEPDPEPTYYDRPKDPSRPRYVTDDEEEE